MRIAPDDTARIILSLFAVIGSVPRPPCTATDVGYIAPRIRTWMVCFAPCSLALVRRLIVTLTSKPARDSWLVSTNYAGDPGVQMPRK